MAGIRFSIDELAGRGLDIMYDPAETLVSERLGSQGHEGAGHEIHVRLRAERSGEMISVNGEISGHVTAVCSRCLGPVPIDVTSRFHLVLLPQHELPEESEDDEIELEPDDLDTAFYSGGVVNLEQHIWDQILLEIPMQPLCSPSCPGLQYDRSGLEEFEEIKREEARKNSPFAGLKDVWRSDQAGNSKNE